MSNMLWERKECVSTEVEDSLVLLDLEHVTYHSLNATARIVWEALDQPRDEQSLVAAVKQRYNVPEEQCKSSVAKLLAELKQLGLVQAVPATNAGGSAA